MSFSRVKDIVDAFDNGKTWTQSYRKVPALASVQGQWVDLSMAPGNPRPNYYTSTALTSATLTSNYGIFTGGNVSPATKCLKSITIGSLGTATPAQFMLCDYLLYYPLIDMDSTDEQIFTNSVSLPRYTDGFGVKAFLVATNPYVGGKTFHISYTNQAGVSGRTSQVVISNTSTYISTIVHSGVSDASTTGAFIPLQMGDTGIRSVQSIQFDDSNGGLATLVLVKPIAMAITRDTTAFSELDYVFERPGMPVIQDGAYLNFLCNPNGTVASVPIFGDLTVIWN